MPSLQKEGSHERRRERGRGGGKGRREGGREGGGGGEGREIGEREGRRLCNSGLIGCMHAMWRCSTDVHLRFLSPRHVLDCGVFAVSQALHHLVELRIAVQLQSKKQPITPRDKGKLAIPSPPPPVPWSSAEVPRLSPSKSQCLKHCLSAANPAPPPYS